MFGRFSPFNCCSLKWGITPKTGMLCFVLINSVVLNLLCVWPLFQNVSAHSCSDFSGLPGNEKADEFAKPGTKGRQQDSSVTFQEKKTLIRAALGRRTESNDFHFLDRWQQVAVQRLSTRATTDSTESSFGGNYNRGPSCVNACNKTTYAR